MDQVLTPEQLQVIENVARDLARRSTAENMGRRVGSDTFQKIVMNSLASAAACRLAWRVRCLPPGLARPSAGLWRVFRAAWLVRPPRC